jgi:hypothetical protein
MIDKIKKMENQSKSNLSEKQQNLIDTNKFEYKKLTEQVFARKEEIRYPKFDKTHLEEIFKETILC